MSGHPALSPCSTGGTCSISERMTPVVRGMREKDGRCVGCGRSIRDAATVVQREIAEARDLAERVPLLPTKDEILYVPEVREQLDNAGPAVKDFLTETPARRIAREMTEQLDRIKLETSDDPAIVALRETSPEGLVAAIIQLTHQIHGCIEGKDDARAADLRAQRALVKLEIVRRAS